MSGDVHGRRAPRQLQKIDRGVENAGHISGMDQTHAAIRRGCAEECRQGYPGVGPVRNDGDAGGGNHEHGVFHMARLRAGSPCRGVLHWIVADGGVDPHQPDVHRRIRHCLDGISGSGIRRRRGCRADSADWDVV